MWNTSVSDHCCHHCDGVVYKADSVIDAIHHEDKCQTIETLVCRILPGLYSCKCMEYKKCANLAMTGHQKALEESMFSYKDCCNDERGSIYVLSR